MVRCRTLTRGRRSLRRAVAGCALVGLALAVAFLIPLPERLAFGGSTEVLFRDGSPACVFLSPDDRWRVPVSPSEVDPVYVKALLRFEDKRFFWHPGVDPLAIARAVVLDLRHRRLVSGGSTITMQLVRLLEPRPRTLLSKMIEAARAVQLELHLSKQEILTAYLTFLPFGRNVEGVEAAAWAYFGHSARSLSAAEIATLLAVPQDPAHRQPDLANRARLEAARTRIALRLARFGALPLPVGATPEDVRLMLDAAPVPTSVRRFPHSAPHAATWMRAQLPGEMRILTTLDAGLQGVAERILASHHAAAVAQGIHNAALVLVDHESGEVMALVGGFDFSAAEDGAQIAAFAVPRSPGSALKPVLYALALDQGLALPETLVTDVPVRFASYAPHNFEGNYSGLVRLEEALSQSLNVPFVLLLERIGVDRFLGALRQMGVNSLRDGAGHYGLSAAVGGIELTPLELAGVFTTLAGDGQYRPVSWQPTRAHRGTPVLSAGAAYLTRRALSLRNRPDLPDERRLTAITVPVHWKTGTSYGFHDAWAAGSGLRYTAVLWLGNLDRTSSEALVGAQAAAPILFDLLEAVEQRTTPPLPAAQPDDLDEVEVCAFSGLLPAPPCPQRVRVTALRRRVPTTTCPYHVRVDVDSETGLRLAPGCRAGRPFSSQVFLSLPASHARWLRDLQGELTAIPPLAPGCVAGGPRRPPRILSPPADRTLLLLAGLVPASQQVPLEADAEGTAPRVSWFVDGQFLGTVAASERVWWTPAAGLHEVVALDEAGLSDRRRITVQ